MTQIVNNQKSIANFIQIGKTRLMNPIFCKATKWKGLPTNEDVLLLDIDMTTKKVLIQRADNILEIHNFDDIEFCSHLRVARPNIPIVGH